MLVSPKMRPPPVPPRAGRGFDYPTYATGLTGTLRVGFGLLGQREIEADHLRAEAALALDSAGAAIERQGGGVGAVSQHPGAAAAIRPAHVQKGVDHLATKAAAMMGRSDPHFIYPQF